MKTKRIFCIILTATVMVLSSCKKDPEPVQPVSPYEKATKVATENAAVEAAFADAFRQVELAITQNSLKMLSSCCNVTFTPNDLGTWPKNIVIDYGTSCIGFDGVERSGQILVHMSKPYFDSSSVSIVTFNNFYVNNRQITGLERITNLGKNLAGNHVFRAEVEDGNLYSPDGITAYNSIQEREWIEGDNTLLDPCDDVYMITGTANGTTTDGTHYTLVIVSPLRVAIACAWIQSGVVDISMQNIPVINLDYGNGICDNIAVATCSGYTFNIIMP